jgi:GxxExxY protein
VEECLIVEVKAANTLISEHEIQLVNYLTATGLDIGLLINFSDKTVQVKRKYRIYQPPQKPVNPEKSC